MTTQIVFNIDPKIKAKAMKRAKRVGIPFASYLRQAAEDFAEGKRGMAIVEEKFNAKTAKETPKMIRMINFLLIILRSYNCLKLNYNWLAGIVFNVNRALN